VRGYRSGPQDQLDIDLLEVGFVQSCSLTSSLSYNPIGAEGARAIADALVVNVTLKNLA
jgi:hypothetical protein